jgi:starch phosphorylase
MSDRKKQAVTHRGRENIRTGESIEALKQAILEHLYFIQGRVPEVATRNDWYMAVAYAVRDRLIKHWVPAYHLMSKKDHRAVAYLSAEFLMGPHLGNALINLGIYEHVREAVAKLGLKLDDLLDQEEEPGLGNGGLGRLAACFLDSLATLRIGAIGYGVRYEFGIFDQTIQDGWQVEITDKWLNLGNPWEIPRPELACSVKLGGHTETFCDEKARYRVRWIPRHEVKGVPYDTPVPGYLSMYIP